MNDKLDLDIASADLTQTATQRLVLWTIRWAIGFGMIAIAVYFWPAASWLWWIGGAFALLSLVVTLAVHFVLQRKIARVQRKMDEMERLAAEIDEDTYNGGDRT